MNKDPQKINLSLVSHTNVGKTTLARTLLGRDIGEVGDRSHVTIEPEDYVLLRAPDDSELILWDTPGFGDSVRLAERLKARSNPIGWFTSEIWDRLTDKSLWLNQQAIKHVRDKSLVILYLVNASESPEAVPYVKAEMDILAWVNKPVIVLLNQMGEARPPEEEKAEVELSSKPSCPWTPSLAAGSRNTSFGKKLSPACLTPTSRRSLLCMRRGFVRNRRFMLLPWKLWPLTWLKSPTTRKF